MIDVLKGTLSKPYIKQPNCLLCVAPNDKLGYCCWKSCWHLVICTPSPGLAACCLAVCRQGEEPCFHLGNLGESQHPAKAGSNVMETLDCTPGCSPPVIRFFFYCFMESGEKKQAVLCFKITPSTSAML